MVTILGILAAMAALRWNDSPFATASAQGFARQLTLQFSVARRQAICEGTPGAIVINRTAGDITSVQLVRADSGGDVATDEEIAVPSGVTVTAPNDRWEFDYSGTLTTPSGGGTLGVSDGDWNWDLTVNPVTGNVKVVKTK